MTSAEGYVFINTNQKEKDTYWDDGEEWAHIESLFAECDFAAIKWEDKEPWEIAKLIADRRLKCEK